MPSRSSRHADTATSTRPTRRWRIAASPRRWTGSDSSREAEAHYKKALKLTPKDPKVWNDAGYSYYLQGRVGRVPSGRSGRRSKLAPDDERIRTNLGLTLAAAGKTREALPLLSRNEGDAIGHANLGYLLASTGQYDLARQQYQMALSMRPDLDLAQRALAQLDRQEQAIVARPTSLVARSSPARSRTRRSPGDDGVGAGQRPRLAATATGAVRRHAEAAQPHAARPLRSSCTSIRHRPAQSRPLGATEDFVESRPAVGDPVDLVPARDAHQVLPPREGRVDLGQEDLLGIRPGPAPARARWGRRSSCAPMNRNPLSSPTRLTAIT